LRLILIQGMDNVKRGSRVAKLVLFDIDGTLVLTGGAGLRAMNRAFDEIVGAPTGLTDATPAEALKGIPVAGRTDWIIVQDTLARLGRQLDDDLLGRLRERYVTHLRQEVEQPGRGFNGTLPGVSALLDALHPREDVFLGLLTGNFRDGARIKLERFDLWRYFRCGAFGDDSPDRNALVPVALGRAAECGMPSFAPTDVIVVGDTPNDVACAQAVGAVAVGVATGSFSARQLRDCGAAVVFETLEDTDGFGRLL
jgi:phosphoglycolate phosphatase-like HAD superfamily hydrolase